MNISGKWNYKEDFEYGTSEGEAEFFQNQNIVNGIFKFIEKVENDYKIEVSESVTGIISEGKVLLQSIDVTALQNGKEIEYLPNSFEVFLVSENKLVGSTYDKDAVCGVFTLERR